MTTIPEMLRHQAAVRPDAAALVFSAGGRDQTVTYAGLAEAVERYAADLAAQGIRRGDPVLVFVPLSLDLYIVLLGLFRVGAVAVLVDPGAGWKFLQASCAALPPAGLVAVPLVRWLKPFLPRLRQIPRVLRRPGQGGTGDVPAGPAPDDPALVTFTSGSTGHPKGAVRTHRFLLAQHAALQEAITLEPGEVDLTTLPVFVLANLASGVTSVLPAVSLRRPGAVDVAPLAAQITRLRPTRTGGSPAFYLRLAEHPDALAGFQKIYTGGAPVFPSTLRALRRAAPHARVVAVYGSTEAEPVAHVAAEEIADADWAAMAAGRGLLAGRPVPQIRVRIVADQWGGPIRSAAALAAGEVGEIVVTGPHVLPGYLHGRGDEETKFREDGAIWHRTGDAGWLDDSGRLWLLGRCAARIDDEHGTIYPFAVECVAMSKAGVRRAALVRHRDRRILVLEMSGPTPSTETLRAEFAWARVGEVQVWDALPVDRRHNAKIDYPALRRRLDRRTTGRVKD